MEDTRTKPSTPTPTLADGAAVVWSAPAVDVDAVLRALSEGRWAPAGRWAKPTVFLGELAVGDRGASLGPLVWKRVGRSPAWKRLLRGTRGWRQVRGAGLLTRAGIDTSQPLLLLRDDHGEALLLRELPGLDALRWFAGAGRSVREEHATAARIGGLVRAMATAGMRHRDCKLSNVIVCPDGELGLIDTVGVRRALLGGVSVARTLRPMLFEAAGTHSLPRRTLLWRCVLMAAGADSSRAKQLWRALQQELARAGDTTPQNDPLR